MARATDRIVASTGADNLDGGSGNDTISSAGEADTIDGGEGANLLRLAGQSSGYLFQQTASGRNIYSGRSTVRRSDGQTVSNIEQVQFGPGALQAIEASPSIDFNADAYMAGHADLRAAFGAGSVKALSHWLSRLRPLTRRRPLRPFDFGDRRRLVVLRGSGGL